MNFLKYDLQLADGDAVEVTLDGRANVRLMDASNFADYKAGRRHRYYGGLAKQSPVRISAPHAGRWVLTIDLGGRPGRVKASVKTLSSASSGPPTAVARPA